MALAYGSFHELSHQLRFLLFEMGVALSQQQIDHYLTLAHRAYLHKLQQAAIKEGYLSRPLISHHVQDFIEQLRLHLRTNLAESRFFTWSKLSQHSNETIANTALAFAYKKSWANRMAKESIDCSSPEQFMKQNEALLDQWVSLNQALSPSLKEAPPYTRREVLQYSAEFQAQFSIHWGALRKNHVLCDSTPLMAKEFPQEYALWQQKMSLLHVDEGHYQPIPIHPWQWRNQLQAACSSMLDDKSLILLPHHQKLSPSLNRTILMPLQGQTHLKLAAEHNTAIEKILQPLLAHEQHYENTLLLAPKHFSLGGTIFDFSLIKSPNALISSEQQAIPLLSLFASSPLSPKRLIDEFIMRSGLNPCTYFSHYCSAMLPGALHLLLNYGISFVASAEQMTIIFNKHRPQGLILRDLEQLTMKHHIKLENNMDDNTTSLDKKLRAGFTSSLLQNNLSYWVEHLHKEYSMDKSLLWQQVRQTIEKLFLNLNKNLPATYLHEYRNNLFNEPWQTKADLSHLLKPTLTEPLFIKTTNPLAS